MYRYLESSASFIVSISVGITIILLCNIENPAANSRTINRNLLDRDEPATRSAITSKIVSQSTSKTQSIELIPKGLDLVKEMEGFSSQAYLDTDGTAVIGYGQPKIAGVAVSMGESITQPQAEAALAEELRLIQRQILNLVEVDLNTNQLAALISLSYNVGFKFIRDSTLIQKLNSGNYADAANEFLRWDKADVNGRIVQLEGLSRRRRLEKQLFLVPAPLVTIR